MDDARELFKNLIEVEKDIRIANHLIYTVYPAVNDPKLFLRALENIWKGVFLNISAILKFEHIHKRIELSRDPKNNLELFFEKCAFKYGLNNEDCSTLRQILMFQEKHKKSAVEFSRPGKMVIMNDASQIEEIRLNELKEFLRVEKKLLENTNKFFVFRKV